MEYFVIRFYENSTGSFQRLGQKKINLESRWSSILCRAQLEFTATLARLKSCSIFLNFLKLFWILSKKSSLFRGLSSANNVHQGFRKFRNHEKFDFRTFETEILYFKPKYPFVNCCHFICPFPVFQSGDRFEAFWIGNA